MLGIHIAPRVSVPMESLAELENIGMYVHHVCVCLPYIHLLTTVSLCVVFSMHVC